MKSMTVIVLTLALLGCYVCDICYEKKCPEGPCGPGQKLDRANQTCVPCDEETFINQSDHGCTICDACFLPEHHLHEVLLEKCTPLKNSVIACKGDFFFKNGTGCKKGGCYPCTVCNITTPHTPYEASKCGTFTDTQCSSIPATKKMIPTTEEATATPLPAGNDTKRNDTRNEKGNESDWKETVILAVTIPCSVVIIAVVAIWFFKRQQKKQRKQKLPGLVVAYSPAPAQEGDVP